MQPAAAGIFYQLKRKLHDVEIVTEYAKDKTYDGHFGCLEDQIYIFGKQQRRIKRLVNQVKLAVTDSPILLSILYNKDLSTTFNQLVLETFNSYTNINFFIERDKPYVKSGRTQTEQEAIELDIKLRKYLDSINLQYTSVVGNEYCVDNIVNRIDYYLKSLCERVEDEDISTTNHVSPPNEYCDCDLCDGA